MLPPNLGVRDGFGPCLLLTLGERPKTQSTIGAGRYGSRRSRIRCHDVDDPPARPTGLEDLVADDVGVENSAARRVLFGQCVLPR